MSETNHVNGVLTTAAAAEISPELLRNEIDSRITRIRPMATPVDQLGRYASNRASGSMTVQYYAVGTAPVSTTLKSASKTMSATEDGNGSGEIEVTDPNVFNRSDTILIPSQTALDGTAMVLYVADRQADGKLKVVVVNGQIDSANGNKGIPSLSAGTPLIRMGRAAGELDVQTAQSEALPKKSTNFCQIFKAQVEQSVMMQSSNKEVGWTFSDQEEMAIYEMRLGMEKSFLFGSKSRIVEPLKNSEIFLTEGIWNQAGKESTYDSSAFTYAHWLSIMKQAFTGHGASSRKILLAGSELIENLSLLMDEGSQRVLGPSDVVTHWGLDFHEIHSKFGTLLVIMSEVMDSCGHAADGLIIDPEYVTKYVHVPFNATVLDLRSSGQRNTDAVVMTEASCLVLRQPDAHMRIKSSRGR